MGLSGDDVYKICFRSHSLEKEITFRCIDVRFDVNLRQIRLLYVGCSQRIMDLNNQRHYLNNVEHFLGLIRFEPLKFVVDVPSLASAGC
jgi:hypothetical protein